MELHYIRAYTSCLGIQAEIKLPEAETKLPEAEIKLPEAETKLPEDSIRNPAPACLLPEAETLLPQAETYPAAEFISCLPPAWQLLPGLRQLPAWTEAAACRQEETLSPPPPVLGSRLPLV